MPISPANELLRTSSEPLRTRFRVYVLVGSGFEATTFLDKIRFFVDWTLSLLSAEQGRTLASTAQCVLLARRPNLSLNYLLYFITENAGFLRGCQEPI